MITIRKGLDLPIAGQPKQSIEDGPVIRTVAVVGFDYHGMKPTMAVKEGDKVTLGQVLFTDKKTEGVKYTAPAAGTVSAINRGERRVLQSVVIDIEGDEAETFKTFDANALASASRQDLVDTLVDSGAWVSFRTRPFSKVPAIDSTPNSIFVTAMDTNPLAVEPSTVVKAKQEAFNHGLNAVAKLTEGKVFLCKAPKADFAVPSISNVVEHEFAGKHPAGNAGTHIHYLDPVSAFKTVWTIGYQDVIAIGELLTTGQLSTERVVSLGGPQVENPRLLNTRLGACLHELSAGELKDGENRLISGSVFGGRATHTPTAYLGRYHNQVSVLLEGKERPMLHYLTPGANRFSAMPIYLSKFMNKTFKFTTSANGSERAMVPIGAYERLMPLDILATQLLRAIIVRDTESAQQLGCLELDEEDLALCSFVCPGKYEYGPLLRENLTTIEKEG